MVVNVTKISDEKSNLVEYRKKYYRTGKSILL